MSKSKWIILLCGAIIVDLLQLGLNLVAIGVGANRFIDIAVGVALSGFLGLNGISVIEPKRLTSIIATFGFEMIPIVDSLPLWTLDVIYNWSITKAKEKVSEKIPGAERLMRVAPLVEDGERRPPSRRVTIEE